jgi:hypothetical protein
MADDVPIGGGGGDAVRVTQNEDREMDKAPFVLTGDFFFAPQHYPETIRVRKQRELDRSKGFCGGEQVTDTGSKNREIHITGKMRGEQEKYYFSEIVDDGGPFDMSSTTWSGEVRVSEGEYEGPVMWHPPSGEYYYDYTLDLVSTGRDENGEFGRIDFSESTITGDDVFLTE